MARGEGLMLILAQAGFVLVGLFLTGVGTQAALARAVLVATRERLVFSLTGPFRKREWETDASTIAHIAPGPSGEAVNDRPVMQLTVERRNGAKPLGMLAGWREEELQWMATLLNEFYGVATVDG